MILRILKTLLLLFLVSVAAALAWSRWKLDGLARAVAHDSLSGASSVSSGLVHARAWPPAAVIDDVSVRGLGGEEVARIEHLVLPLAPGALLGHFRSFGAPHLEGFLARVRLPPSGQAPLAGLFATGALPAWQDWTADDGRLEIRLGAASAVVLTGVHAEEHSGQWTASGLVEGTTHLARVNGRWRDGKLVLQSSLPMEAVAAAPVLVEAPAVVRGGAVTFEGTLSLDGQHIGFHGSVDARDLLVEGSGPATALQHRLRNSGTGRTHLPLAAEVDLLHGADWARVFREGLATGAPLE